MTNMKRRTAVANASPERILRAKLAVAPITMASIDFILTLLGQAGEYWAGDYQAVLEANPVARVLLETHPAALILAFVPYLATIAVLICRLRVDLARSMALLVTLGHSFGTSTWLLRLPGGILYCVLAWIAARLLWALGEGVELGGT